MFFDILKGITHLSIPYTSRGFKIVYKLESDAKIVDFDGSSKQKNVLFTFKIVENTYHCTPS